MKRFLALYIFFLCGLYIVFYAPTSNISTMFNDLQTKLTLFVLNLFLKPQQLQGMDIWINPDYKIIITKACNGIIPILFLWASIFAYPSKISSKILWSIIGYIVFFGVNIVRILWVVYITETGDGQREFYWAHDLVGNTLLLLTGLVFFILFIKTSNNTFKNL